jgi:hypothetical protein
MSVPLSSEEMGQLVAWYKVRDTLLGRNCVEQDIRKALELASVCEHPNARWLTKLFGGLDTDTPEEARQVFLGCENDPRAVCFVGVLVGDFGEIRRAAEVGDAFAQAWMTVRTYGEERFQWAEKSAAQGEREGFHQLGRCYEDGIGCVKDFERAKVKWLSAYLKILKRKKRNTVVLRVRWATELLQEILAGCFRSLIRDAPFIWD